MVFVFDFAVVCCYSVAGGWRCVVCLDRRVLVVYCVWFFGR